LSDPLAPLVFLNTNGSGDDLMHGLAHALAHLWCGVTALCTSDSRELSPQRAQRDTEEVDAAPPCPSVSSVVKEESEDWCTAVAAELLAPFHADLALLEGDVPRGRNVGRRLGRAILLGLGDGLITKAEAAQLLGAT
jgi:Zn-dependent peptidase ImmA (M78 family)